VRDVIDPGRNLGHVDGKKAIKANPETPVSGAVVENVPKSKELGASVCIPKGSTTEEVCEDCQ
jgi:hypothetical protein